MRKKKEQIKDFQYEKSKRKERFTRKDWFCLGIIIVLFSIVAFYNLGSTHIPNSGWKPEEKGESVILEIEDHPIDKIYYFLGTENNPNARSEEDVFLIEASDDLENWEEVTTIQEHLFLFSWIKEDVDIQDKRYIRVTGLDPYISMNEIAFKLKGEKEFSKVEVLESDHSTGENLIDEPEEVLLEPTQANGIFFDEIYHARTAYEMENDYELYEVTHPVLGKEIISIGIAIFGMNPFGWRFMGVIFGILMIPILYNFIKQMFKKTSVCFVGTFLFTFDFMHFVMSRIATIDTYAVIFTMLIYYFMYRYYQTSFYDTDLKKTFRPLFFCGIFVGIGFASKWNVAYGFIGIAILFFMNMYKRYKEYLHAKKKVEVEHSTDETDQKVYQSFRGNFVKTIFACVLFFVIIPCIIYYLSFIFIFDITDIGTYTKQVIDYNVNMFQFHTGSLLYHPHQSPFYEWPFLVRPMLFRADLSLSGDFYGILCASSPLFCWGGIITMIMTLAYYIKTKDKKALFILIGYFSVWLPWIFVKRSTFIYHYYPALIFVALSWAYVINKIIDKKKWLVIGIVLLHIILFCIYYPVLSGSWTSEEYASCLELFPSWMIDPYPEN